MWRHWVDIVGSNIAAVARPDKIRWPRGITEKTGGTLHLQVQAGRALDVQYATHNILEKVNRYLGYQAVVALKIIQTHEVFSTQKPAPTVVQPSTAVLQQVAPIKDRDLQSALARLGAGVAAQVSRSPQAK